MLTHWFNLQASAVQKDFIIFSPNFWDHLYLALMVWIAIQLNLQLFSKMKQDKSCFAVLSLHIPEDCIIKLLGAIKLIQGLITERHSDWAENTWFFLLDHSLQFYFFIKGQTCWFCTFVDTLSHSLEIRNRALLFLFGRNKVREAWLQLSWM